MKVHSGKSSLPQRRTIRPAGYILLTGITLFLPFFLLHAIPPLNRHLRNHKRKKSGTQTPNSIAKQKRPCGRAGMRPP